MSTFRSLTCRSVHRRLFHRDGQCKVWCERSGVRSYSLGMGNARYGVGSFSMELGNARCYVKSCSIGMGNARSRVRSYSLRPAMQSLPLEIFPEDGQCKVYRWKLFPGDESNERSCFSKIVP
jgi:hypothetical protein